MLKNQNIFVTGATGFIARQLVQELVRDNRVVALVRTPRDDGKERELLASGIRVVRGDLLEPSSYAEEICRADYVFHFAALFNIDAKKEELYQSNVLGTKALLETCRNSKIKRIVCCSSAYVLASHKAKDGVMEDGPYPKQSRNWYEWSKIEMEKLSLRYYRDYGLPIVIIRPVIVYGPGNLYGWFIALDNVYQGRILLTSGGKNKLHFICVYDVINAAIYLAQKEEATGQIYNLCDDHPYTQKEAVTLIRQVMGVEGPLYSLPKCLFKLLLHLPFVAEFFSGATAKVIDYYADSCTFSNQKLKNTGFSLRYPDFKDGLKETLRWYKDSGIFTMREPIRMRRLVNRWTLPTVFLFGLLKGLQYLKSLGMRPRDDGWRHCASVYLRTEQCKFVLVAMGLKFFSPPQVIRELREFLRPYSIIHYQLRWTSFSTQRIPKEPLDIVWSEFKEDGSLASLIPYLDTQTPDLNIDERLKAGIIQKIITVYNETRNLSDKKRPHVLKKRLNRQIKRCAGRSFTQAEDYVQRILSSVFINFETMRAPLACLRFVPPPFIRYKHPGWGVFNIVCRQNQDKNELDLWLQCHHAAVDGMPLQEILDDLKRKWGSQDIKLPSCKDRNMLEPQLCSTDDAKEGIYSVSDFVNFQPLIETAEVLKQKYRDKIRITPLRLFVWKLGLHPVFKDKKFPQVVSSLDVKGIALNIFVRSKYAYVTVKDGEEKGLLVIDISEPRDPKRIGSFKVEKKANGVYVDGEYAYVGACPQ
ncbi:MAG: NAD-dependent epimerase/dehydratase family protein, partial [Candidatus Omnitrophica bacterium]|nr:NAD-dependent epimerase/dehydratase family protein [Candidatus Omnitrophota bacterium]